VLLYVELTQNSSLGNDYVLADTHTTISTTAQQLTAA